jgi:hypothetical protein
MIGSWIFLVSSILSSLLALQLRFPKDRMKVVQSKTEEMRSFGFLLKRKLSFLRLMGLKEKKTKETEAEAEAETKGSEEEMRKRGKEKRKKGRQEKKKGKREKRKRGTGKRKKGKGKGEQGRGKKKKEKGKRKKEKGKGKREKGKRKETYQGKSSFPAGSSRHMIPQAAPRAPLASQFGC